MRVRVSVPYATKTKGRKDLRIGAGTLELAEFAAVDAPVVAVQRERAGDTPFRMIDGQFYRTAFPRRTVTGRTGRQGPLTVADLPRPTDTFYAGDAAANAIAHLPFAPEPHQWDLGSGWAYTSFNRDTEDDLPGLLASKSWARIMDGAARTVVVDGVLHFRSIGPAYVVAHEDGKPVLRTREPERDTHPSAGTVMVWDREILVTGFGFSREEVEGLVAVPDGVDLGALDTGYDPLAVALADVAWDLLNQTAGTRVDEAGGLQSAVLALRQAVVGLVPEAEGRFGSRYPANPMAWDTVLPDPERFDALLPLIQDLAHASGIGIHMQEQVELLRRGVEARAEDSAALAAAFR